MQTLTAAQFLRIADEKNYQTLWNIVQQRLPKPHKFLIAGGAIRRTISGEKLEEGDIDLFFKNNNDHEEYKMYLSDAKDIKLFSEKEHVDTYQLTWYNTKYEIQLIKIRHYADATTLLDSFDYTVTQFAMDPNKPEFYAGDFSLYDLGRKRLAVNKIMYPTSSLRRLIKYTNQGYYACNGCLQTFIDQTRDIPEDEFASRKITYVD